MMANARILDYLNRAIRLKFAAFNQYWTHSRLHDEWGHVRVANRARQKSLLDMQHAERLIARVAALDGYPDLQRPGPPRTGQTPRETLECDLATEQEVRALLGQALDYCASVGDRTSAMLYEDLLASAEEHIAFLQSQITLLDTLGVDQFAWFHARQADEGH